MRDLSLVILCDMADAGERCRSVLWSEGVLDYYLDLLDQRDQSYFQIIALEAITKWLEAEPHQVEDVLAIPSNIERIVRGTTHFGGATGGKRVGRNGGYALAGGLADRLLGPIERLVRSSKKISAALAKQKEFVRGLMARMEHPNVFIRTDSLKILLALKENREKERLDAGHTARDAEEWVEGMTEMLNNLRKNDPSVMVKNAANKLLEGK